MTKLFIISFLSPTDNAYIQKFYFDRQNLNIDIIMISIGKHRYGSYVILRLMFVFSYSDVN